MNVQIVELKSVKICHYASVKIPSVIGRLGHQDLHIYIRGRVGVQLLWKITPKLLICLLKPSHTIEANNDMNDK